MCSIVVYSLKYHWIVICLFDSTRGYETAYNEINEILHY